MSFDEFCQAAARGSGEPPAGAGLALRALWHDARGEWDRAHACAQEDPGADGAWVHAYLHRKEGDSDNAAYWYQRANRPVARGTLPEEWAEMVRTLLA